MCRQERASGQRWQQRLRLESERGLGLWFQPEPGRGLGLERQPGLGLGLVLVPQQPGQQLALGPGLPPS